MKTSMIIAAPQITSSGPRCLSGGSTIPATFRAPTTSTSRLSFR